MGSKRFRTAAIEEGKLYSSQRPFRSILELNLVEASDSRMDNESYWFYQYEYRGKSSRVVKRPSRAEVLLQRAKQEEASRRAVRTLRFSSTSSSSSNQDGSITGNNVVSCWCCFWITEREDTLNHVMCEVWKSGMRSHRLFPVAPAPTISVAPAPTSVISQCLFFFQKKI